MPGENAQAQPPALTGISTVTLPRVTIQYCTQCKWMLRAAYLAQELLSTFSTSLGEVALVPSVGGTFTVKITHASSEGNVLSGDAIRPPELTTTILWDRKAEGGFPEVKELKRRVRDVVDPTRNLGHVDKVKKSVSATPPQTLPDTANPRQAKETLGQESSTPGESTGGMTRIAPRIKDGTICEDCT